MIDISQLTKEQINELELQILKYKRQRRAVLETVLKYFRYSLSDEYSGNIDSFVEFTQAIREKTLKEVIYTIQEVPIEDTYIEAICRALDDKDLFPEF